jgi:hypothetical protein
MHLGLELHAVQSMGRYSPQLPLGHFKTDIVKLLYFADKAALVMTFAFDRGCSKKVIKSSSFVHVLLRKIPVLYQKSSYLHA